MSKAGGNAESGDADRLHHAPRIGALAERLARWSATRPWRVLAGAAVVLVLSLLSLSQLHITSSLAGMLGTHSAGAAAMGRVTTEYQTGDALLLLVELPRGRVADEAGRAELVAFATRLEAALKNDPTAARLVAWVKFHEDPALLRFAQEVMLPNGAFYLSDESAAELMRRLEPGHMHEQLSRNEAMISAPGPAGVALSTAVLRDPLRLLELIPPNLRPGQTNADGIAATGQSGVGKPELSEDQRALLVHIGSATVGSDYEAAGRLVDAVVRCSAEVNTSRLRIEPAGAAAIARDSSRVIRRDSVVSCMVSVGLLYVLFLVFYRRWTAGLVIGGVAAIGMLAGVGILALVIDEVSPLAAMIAALLAGLGTDYGIHFLSHYDGYRDQGLGSVDASVQTAQHIAVPIVTNCFTSIFGFISLWPLKIQMLSDFAVMGAAGLIGALIAVFTLMPAALAVIDRAASGKPAGRATFGRLADAVAKRPRVCMGSSMAVVGVAVVAAALQGFSLRFESDLTVLHPRPSRALDTTGEVIRRFSGQGDLVPIEVRASTPEELVAAAHDAAMALNSPTCRAVGVQEVIGLHTLLPDPRNAARRQTLLAAADPDRALQSFDAAIDASDFAPAAYTRYRDFLRTLLSSRHAPSVQEVLEYPEIARRVFPAACVVEDDPPTSTVLLARLAAPLHDRVQRRAAVDALNGAAASVRSGVVTVAGIAAVSAELEEAVRHGLPQSVALSFVLVLLWLILVFRRPVDVLLALVPLVFAAGTTVLFVIAMGQAFNPINSVAIPLLDGIAVDSGVFLVSVYRAHGGTRDELRIHLRSTTHAVLLSVGTTATAFAALCFTHTPAVRSLGFVSAVGVVASGMGALFLLMPILIRRATGRVIP
ncbi:MAG: MMPL family transporter [Phycisphaerales bacterium]|nr:MMPL family transporter [Phycisphaerales bacterium]